MEIEIEILRKFPSLSSMDVGSIGENVLSLRLEQQVVAFSISESADTKCPEGIFVSCSLAF